MLTPINNARFWIWWNGSWCKLTLRPGQQVAMRTGGLTDEGFSVTSEGYSHDGDVVSAWIRTDSRDCDDPHSYDWDGSCPIDELHANSDHDGPATPAWKCESSSQCDLYAEMAGY